MALIMVFHTYMATLEIPPTTGTGSMMKEKEDTELLLKVDKRNKQGKIFFLVFIVGFVTFYSTFGFYAYYNAGIEEKNSNSTVQLTKLEAAEGF